MFGKQHQALVDWLDDEWWRKGPPVCVISGLPGSGKTRVAVEAMNNLKSARPGLPIAFIKCVESKSDQTDDILLAVTEELAADEDREPLERLERGEDVTAIFGRLLVPSRLIVVDEAQHLLVGSTGTLPTATASYLERWSKTVGGMGRLLLLTSREFDSAHWANEIEFRRIGPLDLDDAEEFLLTSLDMAGRALAVPRERVGDVIAWLGGNPGAIRLLVSALARDSLNDLIGLAPEAWEARDRPVSSEFLRKFEAAILSRAEKRLDPQARIFLARLSVFRQSADSRALQAVCPPGTPMGPLRDDLVARSMLELTRNRYEMREFLRETVRARMTDAERRRAHLAAGRYYAAPFRAQQALGTAEKLGARFIEARYHFTLAESQSDLDDISARFEAHYRTRFGPGTAVPKDAEELNERIALLSALLQSRGAMGLEYHLARCLVARNRPGDMGRALPHARRATGPYSPDEAWVLRLRIEEHEFGAEQSTKVAREALASLAVECKAPIYHLTSQILARDGKPDEAIDLLRQGIAELRPEHNLFSLYQAAAQILSQNDKPDEAINLLLHGAEGIADARGGNRLKENAIFLALAEKCIETLPTATFGPKQSDLLTIASALAQDNPQRAADLGVEALPRAGNYFAIFSLTAFALLSSGDPAKAKETLSRFPRPIAEEPTGDSTWLRAFISLELGEIDETKRLLDIFRGGNSDTKAGVDKAELLRLWDHSPSVAFHFPRLAPELTGLNRTIVRHPYGGPVLTEEELMDVSGFGRETPTTEPAPVVSSFDAARVLIAMQPDRWHGLYVLGCYDKTKTVYTQQCRALTLIHALFEAVELQSGGLLGIVGGGAAGVTAAAAAAQKGAKVVLFERTRYLLPIQRQNTKRYLHPHLFDWPAASSTSALADLPLLDWKADRSNVVAAEIVARFNKIAATTGNIDLRLGVSVQDVLKVPSPDQTRRIQLLAGEGEITELVDVAIVAIGFGVEPTNRLGVNSPPYWEDDGLEQALGASPGNPLRILVSGAGDGALIDLLRASIRDFRHEDIINLLPESKEMRDIVDKIRVIEAKAKKELLLGHAPFVNLQKAYNELTLPQPFLDGIRSRIRDDTEVWFNFDTAGRYTLNSSILNRFLVSVLCRLGAIKPKLATLDEKSVTRSSGKYAITWPRSTERDVFDKVVIRHGPPLNFLAEVFPILEDPCAPLRGKLRQLDLTGVLDETTRRYFAG